MVDIRAIIRHDAWLDLEVRWPVLRATGNSEDKRDDATATQSLG
jgi:hypothetical protein